MPVGTSHYTFQGNILSVQKMKAGILQLVIELVHSVSKDPENKPTLKNQG